MSLKSILSLDKSRLGYDSLYIIMFKS